ncbi:hypothetical protein NI17_021110 [Thermobifida halotolerans]|uniref:Uncharacterized protein n=1 Tax=Thermobifida halotolerans TaxID=483545 RepID=A0A399G0J0_9ACTN|nr:hypothetical protein [Thermobifida halotolerans]UOE19217.1 hypothetical protein NI17_021110 [Thermobifida halotolerans]
MGVIRAEHVEELLRSADAEAVLVVRGGAAEVVPRARLGDPEYRGALQVASRRDLEGEATAGDPEALARNLDATVEGMGG